MIEKGGALLRLFLLVQPVDISAVVEFVYEVSRSDPRERV
jgi:hypothetical protein